MKSTAERLKKAFCVPVTEDDWAEFSVGKLDPILAVAGNVDGTGACLIILRNGLPRRRDNLIIDEPESYAKYSIPHFIDLLHDRITPWRLEEDGFDTIGGVVYRKQFMLKGDDGGIRRIITVITDTGRVYLNDGPTNVTTYTDLLTLIRLIG